MKIRTQIIGLVSVILGMMVLAGGFFYLNLTQIRNQISWLVENDLTINKEILDITTKHHEHRTLFERTLDYGDLLAAGKVERETYDKTLSQFKNVCMGLETDIQHNHNHIDSMSNADLPAAVLTRFAYIKPDLAQIRDQHHVCMPKVGEIFRLIDQGKMEQAHVLAERMLDNEEQLDNLLITFLKKLEVSNQATLINTKDQETEALFTLMMLFGICVLIGIGLSIFISRRIVRSLGYAGSVARMIGLGDRNVKIKQRYNDETGVLLRTMKTMLASLNEAEQSLKSANEELEGRVNERTMELQDANKTLTCEINERKKVEQRLLEINRELNTFMYKTSHDLKGPVVSMKGILNLARLEYNDDTQFSNYLEMVELCVEKLDQVLLHLHEVTTVKGRKEVAETLNLNEVVQKVISRTKGLAEANKVRVQVELKGDEVTVSDPDNLETMLFHLVRNALQYHDSEKDGATCRIEIDHSDPTNLSLLVEDNGIGISSQQQEEVFNMFYRGSYRSEGSGLGLYIVKWAAMTMNGNVMLASDPGKGTSVRLSIPVRMVASVPLAS